MLTKAIHMGRRELFKLTSAMEFSLARDLISDEEWVFFERFILTIHAPNGRKPSDHCLALEGIFWIFEPESSNATYRGVGK